MNKILLFLLFIFCLSYSYDDENGDNLWFPVFDFNNMVFTIPDRYNTPGEVCLSFENKKGYKHKQIVEIEWNIYLDYWKWVKNNL
jgi:hypothetical protein